MKKINFLENEKYENWFFVPMMILVTVPLIIMGVIAYSIYYRAEVNENNQQLESYCENICAEYDNIMDSLKSYYLDVSAQEEFQWLHKQKNIPYSQPSKVAEAQALLSGNYLLMNYISNYNYINVEEGWVLGKYGMFPYEDAKNIQEMGGFLEESNQNPRNVYWMNCMDKESPYVHNVIESKIIDTSQMLFVMQNHNLKGELSYILIVQLNTSELNKIIKKNEHTGFETIILSNDKKLVGSIQKFTEKYTTYSCESDVNGITCISGYNRRELQDMGFVFILASVVFAAVLICISVLIRYLAIRFTAPIQYFKKMIAHKNIQIKELFVSNLMTGKDGIREQEIRQRLENMELSEWPLYRMMIVSLKKNTKKELTEEILRKFPKEILELVFVVPVYQNGCLIFLIGEKAEFSLEEKTAFLYKLVKDFIWENYQMMISAGISRSTRRLVAMQHSYEECLEALYNRRNKTEEYSTLVSYDDYSWQTERKRNAYDIVIEEELIVAIEKGNKKEAEHLLELALDILERRSVTGVERNIYLVRLLTAMMSVPQKKGILLNDIFSGELYEDISYYVRIYDNTELLECMKNKIVYPLIDALVEEKVEDDTLITKRVLKMIKESKGSISLSECAQQVNYHMNHVGKLLKRDTGKTFSELANEEKMETAKFMLLTTDYSIAEISEKLSYNNVQNFIRFFKSNAHVTPSVFRKNHKH